MTGPNPSAVAPRKRGCPPPTFARRVGGHTTLTHQICSDRRVTMAEVQEQVQEKAEEAKEQVKEATGEARDQARSRVRGEVDRRSTEVGQQVSDAADAMRRVSETLREEGKDGPARAADQAAERAQRAGSWLQESDADRILRE